MIRRLRFFFVVTVWVYVLAALGVYLLTWFGGDRWWLPTVILFGPRWIVALPLLVLVPLALAVRWRLVLPLLATGLVLLVGFLGFCLPLHRVTSASGSRLRVLTLNVHVNAARPDALRRLIEDEKVEVVFLQECSPDFAMEWPAGWHSVQQGQLVIGAKFQLTDERASSRRIPPSQWPPVNALYVRAHLPAGTIGVCNVHLRSPREGFSAVLDRHTVVNPKRSWALTAEIRVRDEESRQVTEWLAGFPDVTLVGGDFNMPVESVIYRRHWLRYANSFSRTGWGFGATKCSPIRGFEFGSRIDHLLLDGTWQTARCWVGLDVGSDHLPLLAELRLVK